MKLASYQDGSRDGHLVVVSHNLTTAHYASGIATRLQQVLDDWNFLSPQLEDLSTTLNHGRARHAFPFEAALCLAPLPRTYERVMASGDGLVQCSGSTLAGASLAAPVAGDVHLAVVCGDVGADATPDAALEGVRLLLLGFAFDGAAAFAPLAVTPDELGGAWRAGLAHLGIELRRDGRHERVDAATMPRPFGELIAGLARGRAIGAGSIVGGGALASLPAGVAKLRIDATGADGHSIFGAISASSAAA